MRMHKASIPENWSWVPLGDIIEVNPRYSYDKEKSEYPHVPMAAVSENEKRITEFTTKDNIYSGLAKFKQGDVLFARITPCTENGKLALVEQLPDEEEISFGSSELAVLSPSERIDKKFLYYLCQAPGLRRRAINQMKGASGRKRVPYSFFREDIEVPLPPRTEQEEIVKRLDQVFEEYTEIDREYRREQEIESQLHFSVFLSFIEDVPTEEVSTGHVIEESQYGISEAMNEESKGYPILRMGNYDERGVMDYSKVKHVELSDSEFAKYKLEKGDILFNRTNSKELVGKTAIYDGALEDAVFASYLIRVFIDEDKILPEYFVNYLNSPLGRAEMDKKSKQAVSQANINTSELNNMRLLLPSLEDQKEILRKFRQAQESLISIEKESKEVERVIENLPKSILKDTFRGELDVADRVEENLKGQSSLQQF